ncbi:MAG TPA: haloacid dehalogenase-like hydrolase [Thermoanaerobaculia bacterium]|nr:haloacid dehalogenase-like hydrolase [Thermoanaerobaculia bacterium]
MRLALFDIDGTLISDGGAARAAYAAALEAMYGYRGDLRRYDFSGRTDPQITHMVLRDFGLAAEEIDASMDALWSVYLDHLATNVPGRVRALRGVLDLLDALAADARVTLALLTGNIEPGARLKLAGADLNRYFRFGAFGSDSPRREELPPIAVARASAITGIDFRGRDVVIVGDSIYDIRCGVPHDATTIAIASGKTAAELLRAENPHHFFESAEDKEALLAAIVG